MPRSARRRRRVSLERGRLTAPADRQLVKDLIREAAVSGCRLFRGPARLRWIGAGVDLLLDLQTLLARTCQSHNWVGAEGQAGLLAVGLRITHPPKFGADRHDFKVEPAAVRKLVRFLAGFATLKPSDPLVVTRTWAFWSHFVLGWRHSVLGRLQKTWTSMDVRKRRRTKNPRVS